MGRRGISVWGDGAGGGWSRVVWRSVAFIGGGVTFVYVAVFFQFVLNNEQEPVPVTAVWLRIVCSEGWRGAVSTCEARVRHGVRPTQRHGYIAIGDCQ